jgi:hypothetical protein
VREGRFAAEATYRIDVVLENETHGIGSPLNPNTFALEIVDADSNAAGLFSGFDANVERPPGQELVVGRGEVDGVTRWSFEWTAPSNGGPLSLHLAGVDGDGAAGRFGRTGDPFGDDVFVGDLELLEEGTARPIEALNGGCSAGGSSAFAAIWILVLALARRRSALAPLLLLAACHDPTVPADPCARAICETRDAGSTPRRDAGFVPPGTDAGPLPDGYTPPDAGEPPDGCVPAWSCSTWQTDCASDEATRACTDANACGSDFGRPSERTTLGDLDYDFFRCNVQPIFDRTCAQQACHGAEDRPLRTYARLKWRIEPLWRGTHNDGGGTGLTDEEWCRNYDSARSFASATPETSELLTQPLDPALGGLSHAGYTLFYSTTEDDYRTIASWLAGTRLGRTCNAGYNE